MYLGVLKNHTLYIDQFTDEPQKAEKNWECLIPKSLEDVFAFFLPSKEKVALKREDGSAVFEKFVFHHLSDFDDDQLISQSDTLKTLHGKKDISTVAAQFLKENLISIHEEIKVIETAYRTLALLFDNASPELDGSLSIMNVNREKLGIFDSDDTTAVREELNRRNNLLSRIGRYGILVIPGYLGEASVVRMWAVIAHKNKILLISDFMDCFDYDTLIAELNKANLQSSDICLANAVMTCNYITASYSKDGIGDCNKLYLPASAALAGLLANTDDTIISEGISGIEHGKLKSVNNTRINISETEAAALTDMGIIVITHQNDYVFPVSNRTLYLGCTECLKEYPLCRTLNWIGESIEYNYNSTILWAKFKQARNKQI